MNTASIDLPNKVLEYLRDLSGSGFWGSITLKYEAGSISHIRREENIKPSELSGRPRLSNETHFNQ
jgi:hypothetical protein